jgi:hypothetical protein
MKIPKEMEQRIIRMASITWDQIGGDVLTSLEQEGKYPVLPREHVIETVCDADYMLTHGGDKEAYKFWDGLKTYEEKKKVVGKAFLFKSYGW